MNKSRIIIIVLAVATGACFCAKPGLAASATWSSSPASGDWSVASNWVPMTVPNSTSDIATFGPSNRTAVSVTGDISVNGIIFASNASAFTITVNGGFIDLSFSGAGITNNSPTAQQFVLASGGFIDFFNTASAANSIFALQGATISDDFGGQVTLSGNASAAQASFTIAGGTASGARGGVVEFRNTSTAGNSTITADGGVVDVGAAALISFRASSTAASATLTANTGPSIASAGKISFRENSLGANARINVFGNGNLEAGSHNAPAMSVGSIEGDGYVFVGSNMLSVGANNATTAFSGHIQDTGGLYTGSGGSLTKTGTGTLSLTNSNTYTGGTTISSGVLAALHDQPLGPGNVNVGPSGTLTFDAGVTNNYIADTANLSIASSSIVNLNFTGDPDRVHNLIVGGVSQPPGLYGSAASGAPNQLAQFTGPGTFVVGMAAVSRKTHGAAGSFDVALPFTGPPGIECRSGDPNADYQLVITFFTTVMFDSAAVTSGTGMVASASGNGTSTIVVNLTGVANAQTINTTLFGVNNGTTTSDLVIPMGILVGDTNGDRIVNASDIAQAKAQSGQPITNSNFHNDVNVNGIINASDTAFIKSKSGTFLP